MGLGVNVGIVVGGAVTLKPMVAVAGSKVELPAKFAVSAVIPATAGVSVHDALPLALVVPKQELPSNVSLNAGADDGGRRSRRKHRSASRPA